MSASRGFTLLELMLGMTLLGFMLALLFGGFRLASTSWDAVETRVERTNDEALGRALVRRLLTQMQPLRWKKTLNQPVAFSGTPDGLRAVTPLTAQAGAGGLRLIELRRERAGEGREDYRLLLREAPLRYDAESAFDGLAGAKSHTVISGLEGVRFSYFGPAKRGEPSEWQDTWGNPEQLPQLVRVSLESHDRGWTDLMVAPMIGGTGCRWDAFHKVCR